MGFFSHAAMLGIGYWIGKSYCFRYKVTQLPNEPDSSEILLRVERKEGAPFWASTWNHHHYCHARPAVFQEIQPLKPKNPELLEVKSD
ncbi:unnamed protein product [Caenorhabditis sp. 36 PRJEB53466]|nr:unnamed protein product [Caenorhabditis sp. 36 PRJEB53466]